jgi:hypothetical protein
MAERPVEGTEDDKCTQEVEHIGSDRINGAKDPLKICVQFFLYAEQLHLARVNR